MPVRAPQGSKVFIGLSGGVDSAVSAALLKEAGHDVTGIFAKIAIKGLPCPAAQDRRDAMRVAAHLAIPFKEIDLSGEYEERVLNPALDAYAGGDTPNPDVLCNREIKFGFLYDYSMSQGADYIATGHYARTKAAGGETWLLAGVDPSKDQSYFLWDVSARRLAKTLFPVGELHKSQVRTLAEKFKLPNAHRKDSQGLCFLGDVSLEDLLIEKLHPSPGNVLDESGAVIGSHRGALLYTVGQRHGFTVDAEESAQQPLYVIAKDANKNTITVSRETAPTARRATRITLAAANWIGSHEPGPCEARFRYRQALIPAVSAGSTGAEIRLNDARYVPKGQSLVAYRNERCLGGGVISSAR